MDPGVAALVHHRFQEYLDPGGTELLRGLKNVVDKESGDDTGREVTVDRAVGAETSTLLPSGSLNIQKPLSSRSRRRPSRSRKKATVGPGRSVLFVFGVAIAAR
jgi:hypothetical protein